MSAFMLILSVLAGLVILALSWVLIGYVQSLLDWWHWRVPKDVEREVARAEAWFESHKVTVPCDVCGDPTEAVPGQGTVLCSACFRDVLDKAN